MALFTTPEVTAPADSVTVRAGALMLNAYSTSGSQSFFVDAFDLESVPPPDAPVIITQPSQTTVSLGGTATLTVEVADPSGVTYQWQHSSTNLLDGGNVSGANEATLIISGVSASDVGHYRVLVSNIAGSLYSDVVPLTIMGLDFFPVISLTGKVGDTYRVDYSTALDPTTWMPLLTNTLTSPSQMLIDTSSPRDNTRFYRAIYLP